MGKIKSVANIIGILLSKINFIRCNTSTRLLLVTFPVPFVHATTRSVVLLSHTNGMRANMLILFLSHQLHVNKLLLRDRG